MKKMTAKGIITAATVLLASAVHSPAIEGLRITVPCPDVVLSWPSLEGETYIVQFRPALDTNTPWVTLTNSLPADSGTNITFFVHSNVVQCPTNGSSLGGGTNSGGPPGPNFATLLQGTGDPVAPVAPLDDATILFLAQHRVYPPYIWDIQQRLPRIWELECRPPYPWDPDAIANPQVARGNVKSLNRPTPMDDPQPDDPTDDPTPPDPGFYQVVRVGIHLFDLTNGTVLSGQVPLRMEFGNPDTNGTLSEIFLYNETGDPDPVGVTFPNLPWEGTNHLTGTWDTTKATNGVYTLQVGADLDDGTEYLDQPVTVTVSNIISFPDPYNIGGDAIYVGAKTLYTNGTWHMDLYDDQNTYIGYLNGPIDGDGYCAWPGITGPGFSLDNTDGYGNRNPSSSYSMAITATAAGGGASRTTTNKVFIENAWWQLNTTAVVAYMQTLPPGLPATLLVEMIQVVYSAEEIFHHNLLGTSEIPFQIQSLADWGTVITALTNTGNRDFFYFGHANGSSLGASSVYFDLPAANAFLGNNTNPLVATNMHPYRFVFLDGCLSADGNWPQAFGIPKVEGMTGNDFIGKRGIRPRAFMGWSRKKVSGLLAGYIFNTDHAAYVSTFWNKWQERNGSGGPLRDLKGAIAQAKNAAPASSGGMKLYGANDLIIDY